MDIKNEIKSKIALAGFTLTQVVEEMNKRMPEGEKPTTVQNISNKMTRGTIKYNEVKMIAEIIGMDIDWKQNEK